MRRYYPKHEKNRKEKNNNLHTLIWFAAFLAVSVIFIYVVFFATETITVKATILEKKTWTTAIISGDPPMSMFSRHYGFSMSNGQTVTVPKVEYEKYAVGDMYVYTVLKFKG